MMQVESATKTMKAVFQSKYGSADDLELRDVDRPTPEDSEVLVRVRAASVHPDVWHVVAGRPFVLRLMGAGFTRPKNPIPGTDLAGVVEEVGKGVTQFQPGDEVFGESIGAFQWINGGAFAEYVSVPAECLAHKPGNITFEQAASVPTAGVIALHNLQLAGMISAGQKVLVNGAAGGVGALALQLAKAYGAHVTAVDHTTKLEMLRTLGADQVIDYTQEDFTRGGVRYDLIFDIPGNHSFSECRRALLPTGKYVLIGHEKFGESGHRLFGLIPHFLKMMLISKFTNQLPKSSFSPPNKQEIMSVFKELLEAGKITPIIDKSFPLSEAAEAMRYLASGRARGRIVLTM